MPADRLVKSPPTAPEPDPSFLDVWRHLREAERVFTLSRAHGVMPA